MEVADPIITLNVGGKTFMTRKSIIEKSEFFRGMLEDISYKGEIFVDRSPLIFGHVLDCLRDKEYPYPSKYRSELDYFLIDLENVTLYDEDKTTITAIKELMNTVKELEKNNEETLKEIKEELVELMNRIQSNGSTEKCSKQNCSNPSYNGDRRCLDHLSTCVYEDCLNMPDPGSPYCWNHS